MRSAEEIREHAIGGLNRTLKRPAMYGGWLAAWPYQDTLTYGFHGDVVASARTSEGRFPAGLRLTPAGKERLARRPAP